MEPKCFQKPSRKSIIFLIDFGRQNGRPEAFKIEPKLGQGPPKTPPKNKLEREHGRGPQGARRIQALRAFRRPQQEAKRLRGQGAEILGKAKRPGEAKRLGEATGLVGA